mmetsp:Transcript_3626/g.8671  ORF Transcript_3626/g.8671 Transcript_3626/m.8671 type:complete len:82 (-) Transcript_3626:47-292(-)
MVGWFPPPRPRDGGGELAVAFKGKRAVAFKVRTLWLSKAERCNFQSALQLSKGRALWLSKERCNFQSALQLSKGRALGCGY